MGSPLSTEPLRQVPFPVEAGSPHPLGAAPSPSGVNFSLFSSSATSVELLLFSTHGALKPFQTIRFDPYVNKTFHIWHVLVRGLGARATIRLHWDHRSNALSIGDRVGAFAGMPSKQTFHIVLVKEQHGIGMGSESTPDRSATYTGHRITIALGKAG